MNGFELHGIQHLSASSLNLWASQPALWVMERLLALRSPGNALMARGKAAEEGIHAGLVDNSKTVEECAAIALSAYDKEVAPIQDEKRESERLNIPGYVEHGLAELRQYGVPTAYQDRVEYRLTDLKPYNRNARTHSPEQVAQLAESIRQFGFTNPVLLTTDGQVVAGHGRIEAAKVAGIQEVPALVVGEGWSSEQVRAYILADNQLAENAGWDKDILKLELADLSAANFDLGVVGFESDFLAELLAPEPTSGLTDENAIPEPPKHPVTRRGDLWLLGEHRLLCGDSTSPEDVIQLMDGKRATLFATDPPYLVDYDGTNHPTKKGTSARAKKIANKDWSEDYIEQPHWDDSSQGPQFYEAFMQVAIDCAVAEDAAWYCWHASRRQAMLEGCWKKFDVLHHQQIIWAKSRPVLTRSIMLWAHEPCLFGWRSGKKPRVNREGFESWPTTVWNIPSSEIETREHPTSKPVRVFSLPMELHTVPGEICYEPFSGSGSQHIAGEKTGRRVYGLELSETFCDVIINRWQAFSGKTAVLEGDDRTYTDIRAARLGSDREAA